MSRKSVLINYLFCGVIALCAGAATAQTPPPAQTVFQIPYDPKAVSPVTVNGRLTQQQTYIITWDRPVTYAIGAPLDFKNLVNYDLFYQDSAQLTGPVPVAAKDKRIAPKITQIKFTQPICTTYFFTMTATARDFVDPTKNSTSEHTKLISVSTYCPNA